MTFVVNGTVAALVALLVQVLLKPLIELWLKPEAANHDTVIRATALLLGVALMAVDTLIGGPWPVTGDAWLLLVGSGAISGAAAVGGYHILVSSAPVPASAAQSAANMPAVWLHPSVGAAVPTMAPLVTGATAALADPPKAREPAVSEPTTPAV